MSNLMFPKKQLKTLSKTLLLDPWASQISKVKVQKHSVFSTLALPTWTLICDLQVQLDVAEKTLKTQ